MPDTLDRLKVLINSSTPIVVMETVEEPRALNLIRTASSDLQLPCFEWSIADGLVRSAAPSCPRPGEPAMTQPPIANTQQAAGVLAHIQTMTVDAVFVLKDFHRQLEDPIVVRRMREAAQEFCGSRKTVVITAPALAVPPELESLIEFLSIDLPDRPRLRQIIEETFARVGKTHTLKRTLDPPGLEAMAANLRGLTEEEAERAVAQAIVGRYALSPDCITDVLETKRQLLKRSGMLEFIEVSETMSSVGGLENLKKWLQRRRGAWDDQAAAYGLQPPKGVIILGVQGCGKSMCARAIAGEWQLPLVKFDSAAIFDKYIGETEKRVLKMFSVAEQLAPAILWIDELENVFAGSGPDSASADAGVSSRLLGAFLSWMQDRKSPVFVAATCNNVNALPPELIRKGRFDEIFFVDLPNDAERHAIFAIQIARRRLNPASFDLDKLAAAAQGYSGAEIEAAVQSAMYAAFSSKQPLTTATIVEELRGTVPLSTTRAEEIEQLRDWARQRAVPASQQDAVGKQA